MEVFKSDQDLKKLIGVNYLNVDYVHQWDNHEWFWSFSLELWVRIDKANPRKEWQSYTAGMKSVHGISRDLISKAELLRCADEWNKDHGNPKTQIGYVCWGGEIIAVQSGLVQQLSFI